jgi:4-amino-4-deoxy-L-arabinose transferase-like glycosyltransferase
LLLCLALFLPGFLTLPPIDRDEARFAQASRQMLESGDWVDIRFQAAPRYKKPIAIYWLQAGAAALTDRSAIWAYRLPSLLGAIAAVLLTAAMGARLFGRPVGIRAAAMLAASLLLAVEARLATTDAALLAAILLVQAMLARAYCAGPGVRPGWPATVLLWGGLGLAILLKGPVVLLVAGSTAAALAIADRDAGWLARLRPLAGVGLVLLVVAPWLVAIELASGGAFLEQSAGGDLLPKLVGAQESHGAPPGYYLVALAVGAAPFAPLVLSAVPWAWRQRRQPAVRFCLAWLVPSWLVLELVPTKLPHYVLPLLPAAVLLAAAALAAPPPSGRWRGAVLALGIVIALGLSGTVAALPWWLEGRIDAIPLLGAAAMLGATMVGYQLLSQGRATAAMVALVAAALLQNLTAFELVLPRLPSLWIAPRLEARLAAESPCPGQASAIAGLEEPSLVFALGTATRLVDGAGAAAALLSGPACTRAAVEQAAAGDFLAAVAQSGRQAEPLARIDGFNISKGRKVALTLYRLVPAR